MNGKSSVRVGRAFLLEEDFKFGIIEEIQDKETAVLISFFEISCISYLVSRILYLAVKPQCQKHRPKNEAVSQYAVDVIRPSSSPTTPKA